MKTCSWVTPILTCTMILALSSLSPAFGQDKPDWQKHIDWSIGNNTTDPGETNCVDQYLATEPACVTGGGRACLMSRAINSAKANNCAYAMRLTLITQCHSGGAQQAIGGAGPDAVCSYLKSK
jgi:hypothetical protein